MTYPTQQNAYMLPDSVRHAETGHEAFEAFVDYFQVPGSVSYNDGHIHIEGDFSAETLTAVVCAARIAERIDRGVEIDPGIAFIA